MKTLWLLFSIFAFFLNLYCIELASKRAYRKGHKAGCEFGYDEGYMKGFEVGHGSAERWLADLEVDVQQAREEIWREEC
jgi:hypothetical protein